MNKNQSKRAGIVFVILMLAGLAYLGWNLFKKNPDQSADTTANSSSKTVTPAGSTTTPTTTDGDNTATAPAVSATADYLNFSKASINFTFKYPKAWTINSATATAIASTPGVTQKTVKIITDAGVEYHLDNPASAADFSGYALKNKKDITAGKLIFKRSYGVNSTNGQTLYLATYADPNNLDANSISFYGASAKLDAATITSLDNLVSTFKFVQ